MIKNIFRTSIKVSGMKRWIIILLCLSPLYMQAAHSIETLCDTENNKAQNALQSKTGTSLDNFSTDGKTHLEADAVNINESSISSFKGNVILRQPETRIEADQAIYDKKTEKVQAEGNVNFLTPSIVIRSEAANMNLKTDRAKLSKSEYQILSSRARGEASQIDVRGSEFLALKDATYTTCSPGNTDWLMSASEITLRQDERQGSARHVVLRFKDVPFFYFPYLRFPLGEKRLSGFLFPTFGHSDQHGTEVKIPYYWDIHPQLDVTLTPWNMTKRGLMLQTEFRYLDETGEGTIYNETLNKDKIFKDNRDYWRWLHRSTPALGWQANAEFNQVADSSHLTDFSDDLNLTSATHLLQTASLAYDSQNWLLNIKAEDYQTLSGSAPYKRLPQITFNSRYAEKNNALNYELQSEYVRFSHDTKVVIGDRFHIKPTISWPLRSAAGFLVSNLSLQHTTYNLGQASSPEKISRTIPSFSLDSGLFFEREGDLFQSNYVQTLEPQLFYVYVPFKAQSAIPIFDTSTYAFNFNQPFADTRFNGIDRIGDDNRVTAALATRFLSQKNGNEVFMARVGQVYYFTDRQVQLSDLTPPDTTPRSHIIGELRTQPGNWNLSSQVEYDPALKQTVISSHQLGYQYKDRFNLNLAHRFQRDALETREIHMNWKLGARWQLNTTQLYDLRNQHIVENLYGINYDSCCWALNLSAKERYLSSTQTDSGIYLELVLKGLGGFGSR